jgi:hypothetical protein
MSTDLLRVELGRVRKSGIADLVEGIGSVGDKLAKEDLLVGVESVDDEVLCREKTKVSAAAIRR